MNPLPRISLNRLLYAACPSPPFASTDSNRDRQHASFLTLAIPPVGRSNDDRDQRPELDKLRTVGQLMARTLTAMVQASPFRRSVLASSVFVAMDASREPLIRTLA
jgi:hypothetical protein